MFSLDWPCRTVGVLLASLIATAGAANNSDQPGDYSHLIPLSLSGKQAVVQLPVPRAVYLEARTADLRDLRLFDASGSALPFALVEQGRQLREQRASAPLAIFPIRASGGDAQRLPPNLEIRTRPDGAVISVTAPFSGSADGAVAGLVLAAQPIQGAAGRSAEAPVAALILTPPAGLGSYSARVVLEVSADLQHWEEVAEASLSWLVNNQGARVRKDRVEFAPQSLRYARIRWLEGRPVEFAVVTAELVSTSQVPQRWESVVLKPTPGVTGNDLVYAAPLAVPVEALGLELAGQNVVMPALVGQYRNMQGRAPAGQPANQLRVVARTTFYQLTQNGQRRASGDIALAPTHASQWVVRPDSGVLEQASLRLRWKPATMVFLAAGKGPYTLAFGRDGVRSVQVPVSHVAPGFSIKELVTLEQAIAGEPKRQHSRNTSERPGDPLLRRSIWLWALLLLGVAALALMAWRLSRQLQGDSAIPPPA